MNSISFRPRGSYPLARGTRLYRVHKRYREAVSFNTSQAWANKRDGRFDSDAEDYYPYYYAALSERGALYESIIIEGGLASDAKVPRSSLKDRVLSVVELTADITLLSLQTEEDLAFFDQDEWLVRTLSSEYHLTRARARLLRSMHPWAQGLIWYSRKDPDERSVILFGDRCDVEALRKTSSPSISLDALQTEAWLRKLLNPHQLTKP
jgi:hypothetical protein